MTQKQPCSENIADKLINIADNTAESIDKYMYGSSAGVKDLSSLCRDSISNAIKSKIYRMMFEVMDEIKRRDNDGSV